MHRTTIHRFGSGLLTLTCVLPPALAFAGGADDVSLLAKDDGLMQAWATSPTRLHDAAIPPAARRAVAERALKPPPPPIVEHPTGPPPGPGATWVRGYWRWDSVTSDFTWVTGFWAAPPANNFWVDGSWKRDDQGWYRSPGFWSVRRGAATAPAAVVSSTAAPAADGSPGGVELVAPVRTPESEPAPTPASTTRRVALTQYTAAAAEGAGASVEPLPSPEVPAAELPAAVGGSSGVVASPQGVEPATGAVTTVPAPALSPAPIPTVVAAPSPVIGLADQLAGQAAAFEQVFGRTAGVTPGGGSFLAEARRIRGAAYGLRQAAAAGDAYQMTMAYRDINVTWQQMAARVNQLSPGRTGPNIQQVWRMGATAAEIGRMVP